MSKLDPAFSKLEEAFFAAGERLSETATPYAALDDSRRATGWWQRLVGWYVPARWDAPVHDAFPTPASTDDGVYLSYELTRENDDYVMAVRYDLAA